jgi:putative FmdB family regulatory protein
MPIYEYECEKCGCHREVMQKFSDPPLSTCDECNGPMKRLISQSAFHLKGSGWYVTDYARKSKPDTSGGKAEPSAKKAEAKDTTSSAVDKKD